MSKKPDDRLHVIDRALRSDRLMAAFEPSVRRSAHANLTRAKRFILTDAASTRMGEIIRDTEGLMLGNTQFSIPPYDDCYFEINNDLLYDAADKKAFPRTGDTDNRVGLLTHKNLDGSFDVTGFSMTNNGETAASPFTYHRFSHRPSCSLRKFVDMVNLQEGREVVDAFTKLHHNLEEWARLALMLGTGLTQIPSEEARRQIAHEWSMQPAFHHSAYPYPKPINYTCSVGDVRNLLCLLLLLNQPVLYTTTSVAHSRGLWKGRNTVYAAHSVVEITLGQRKRARRIFEHLGPRNSPKRHEVRGHFMHWHLQEGCVHVWPTLPDIGEDSVPRWTCKACKGLRVWREHFERGDASKGWVDHGYRLT